MAAAKKKPTTYSGQVRAIRSCFLSNIYRRPGDVFYYEGPYNDRCAFRPVEDDNLRSRPGGAVEGEPDPLDDRS